MYISHIDVDSNMQSVLQYGTPQFPIRGFLDVFTGMINNKLNWHWHNELELVIILQGTVKYYLEEQCLLLHTGDGVFNNSGTLHRAEPDTGCNDAIMFVNVFSPEFIMPPQNLVYLNCVSPYIGNAGFPGCALYRTVSWQGHVLEALMEIRNLEERRPFDYELRYHNLICTAWIEIIENLREMLAGKKKERSRDISRAKCMVEYVHSHYAGDISISDIAEAANISKTECFRCFKKIIKKKPFEYLMEYRLEQAIKLLSDSSRTISEVSTACGFNHQSYFGKLFKKFTSCTPSDFRKMGRTRKTELVNP